jgi:hypothetical protein
MKNAEEFLKVVNGFICLGLEKKDACRLTELISIEERMKLSQREQEQKNLLQQKIKGNK